MDHKICALCKKNKPVSEFTSYKKSKDGLRTQCKICRNEEWRAYYKRKKLEAKGINPFPRPYRPEAPDPTKKTCASCLQEKPLKDFYVRVDKKSKDGRVSWCDTCRLAKARENYKKRVMKHGDKFHAKIREARKTTRLNPAVRRRDREYTAWYKKTKPLRRYAEIMLDNYIALGQAKRAPKCRDCSHRSGLKPLWHDTSKPLDVMWLCFSHYNRESRKLMQEDMKKAKENPLQPSITGDNPTPSVKFI